MSLNRDCTVFLFFKIVLNKKFWLPNYDSWFWIFLWFLKLRFVCIYYKHNVIFTLFALCTLVSRITDQIWLLFIRKFFQSVCLIRNYCLLLKIPCTLIYFLPFLPCCTLIRDSICKFTSNLWKIDSTRHIFLSLNLASS